MMSYLINQEEEEQGYNKAKICSLQGLFQASIKQVYYRLV